jgi:hypothetical protein
MGSSEAGGSSPGEENSDDNFRGMDWNNNEVRGRESFKFKADQVLANEQSGDEWNDGRVPDTTKVEI